MKWQLEDDDGPTAMWWGAELVERLAAAAPQEGEPEGNPPDVPTWSIR